MENNEYQRLKELVEENTSLKQELLRALEEKEELVLLCEQILQDKENVERRYKNLRNSKLGRITIWMWEKRGVRANAKR